MTPASLGRAVASALLLSAAFSFAASPPPSRAEIYFRLENPCPSTGQTSGPCIGYVIDRIIPRVCGGPDDPSNMQWQTLVAAREKDRWERIGCRRGRRLVLPGTEQTVTEAFATGEAPPPVEAQPLSP